MQKRPETWKVVTLGVALTGLGIAGVGVAQADSTATDVANTPVGISVEAPVTVDDTVLALDSWDHSWDDSHSADSWDDSF